MRKMYFLGQASNLRNQVARHTFATGSQKDFDALKSHLADRFQVKQTRKKLLKSDENEKDFEVKPENVALYHTGRSALAAGLKAVVPKENGEHPGVIVNSLTCYAVVQAVKAAGFVPVFADVDLETLHFNGETIEKALKKHKNVRAVIVQNNLGIPAHINSIIKTAEKHNLLIIEDLAHSAGISYNSTARDTATDSLKFEKNKEAGTVGVATILSFGKGKSVDTSEGGALVLRIDSVTYKDSRGRFKTKLVRTPKQPEKRPKLSDSLRDRWYPFFGRLIRFFYRFNLGKKFTSLLLKLHWIKKSADASLDTKTRLTFWQAKLALKQLEELPENRPPLREFYIVENRDEVLRKLEEKGFVMSDTWYDCPIAPERYFKKVDFTPKECPVATEISKHIVNLPTFYPRTSLQPARKIIAEYNIQKILETAISDGSLEKSYRKNGGKNA